MIELQPLKKEHLNFLLEIRNDDSTRNNLENNSIFTLENCEEWFETLKYPLRRGFNSTLWSAIVFMSGHCHCQKSPHNHPGNTQHSAIDN